MPLRNYNYIDGIWQPSIGNDVFESANPANRHEILGQFYNSNASDVDMAVNAAKRAFKNWGFELTHRNRAEYMYKLRALMEEATDEMSVLICKEIGKNISSAKADWREAIHTVEMGASMGYQTIGERISVEFPEKLAYWERRPKGVAAVITPWNFIAILFWGVVPNLVEGNTVVIKPAEQIPLVSHKAVELFDRAGFPPGVVNMVQGYGYTGEMLVKHKDIDLVLFTGSYAVGKQIQKICAEAENRLDKLAICETGSKSGLIVCEDADVKIAAEAALMGSFNMATQRCVSTQRYIVNKDILPDFLNEYLTGLNKKVLPNIGDPSDPNTYMGPLIEDSAISERFMKYRILAEKEGAKHKVVVGNSGFSLPFGYVLNDEKRRNGSFVSPDVFYMEWNPDSRVLNEECFAPVIAIIPYGGSKNNWKDAEEAMEIFNHPSVLSMAVVTKDVQKWSFFRRYTKAGLNYWNAPGIGADVNLPFGGSRMSGSGMPTAKTLHLYISHPTAFTINEGSGFRMAQGLK